MTRRTLAAAGRRLYDFRYAILWVLAMLLFAWVASDEAVTKTDACFYGAEIVTFALVYLMLENLNRRSATERAERYGAELDAERTKTSGLLDLAHEHYLAAIRDHDMTPESYDRCSRLTTDSRRVAYPQLFDAPRAAEEVEALAVEVDAEDRAATEALDRQVRAETWAGYGPDGHPER